MLKEFKDFISKGNVLDLAVAVVMGGAFGAIVTSLVNDLIMPIVSLVTGGVDFAQLYYALDGGNYANLAAAQEAGAATLNYGLFIQAIVNFVIIAFTIFLLIRQINKSKAAEPTPPPPGPSAEEKLLGEIRDLLARK